MMMDERKEEIRRRRMQMRGDEKEWREEDKKVMARGERRNKGESGVKEKGDE